ncbi:MAG: molybdopterin-guanine dinucleotide biosynthesis protein B [Rhodospirillales bacterium]|nr:molybdopterin-guanine dinucleotide biosynthesis protein B [Rhodospirillales bacterium]
MPDPTAEAGAGQGVLGQRVLGLAGWSGSGKTTLVTAMIPLLVARGHSVSTLKHAHHRFDIDRPGKDSFRHREAGAQQVLVSSAARWALITEHRGAPEPDSAKLLAKMEPVDLVIVEGFKREAHDKLEILRPSLGKPALWPEDPHVVAVVSDAALPDCPRPVLPLNDAGTVVDFVIRHCGLAGGAAS